MPTVTGEPRIEPVGPERLMELVTPIGVHIGFEPSEPWAQATAALEELDTRLAVLEGERVVASLASFGLTLTVPGGEVPMAGLSLVGVLPTHRRRGLLTAMLRRYLDGERARGRSVSALWASEGAIYGRFGYGLASLSVEIDVPRPAGGFRGQTGFRGALAGCHAGWRARLLDEAEAAEALPPLYERVRPGTAGMLSRSARWWHNRRIGDAPWQRRGQQPLQRVVLDLDGVPEAYALYRHAPAFEHGAPKGTLQVQEAFGVTGRGTRAVWEYLFGVDLVERVRASFLAVDHPLLFLLQHPERLGLRAAPGLWVRLIDLPAALAARGDLRGDGLVLEVQDAFCPWNEGRWRLEGNQLARTTAAPELRLDVTALGSAYLGGFALSQHALAGQVQELVPGALARADAIFRTARAPWCPEIF